MTAVGGAALAADDPTEARSETVKNPPGASRARRIFESRTGVARWVAAVEIVLGAIEQVAWEARQLYEQSLKEVHEGWSQVRETAGVAGRRGSDLLIEAQRLQKIAFVMPVIVFSYRLLAIRGAFMSAAGYRRAKDTLHRKNARRFIKLAESLQGGMVKIGQMLSARTDLLPRPFTEELAKLQDAVQPLPFDTVRDLLVATWGAERLDGVNLSTEPIGAASIAQVHLATLLDGRQVAVKVRRPEIESVLAYDVRSMRRVVDALTAYLPDLDLQPLIDEVAEQLLAEVDFRREARSLTAARAALKGHATACVPEVLEDWCGDGVLVTEFCPGERLDKALANRSKDRRDAILAGLAGLYLRQILVWGFFQPDTHPGNFLVGDDDRLVLLDFGCVRDLPLAFRRDLTRLLQAFVGGDDRGAAEALADLGFETRSGDLGALVGAARATLGGLVAGGSDAWDVQGMIDASGAMLDAMEADPVTRIPGEMVMVGRALSTMGGLFYEHKPDLDPMRLLLPVMTEVFAARA